MGVVLYAGSARFTTTAPDRSTHHSFSFGPHYDPANLGFGPLVAHNDDHLRPGGGYPDHPHADIEIVTWVLDGALVHTDPRDPAAGRDVLGPGTVQVQSAGSGIRHAEIADTGSGPTRFVQAWLRPDRPGLPPERHRSGPGDAVAQGDGLITVAGGAGLPLGVAGARLLVGRLAAGEVVELPPGPRHHVFVARGSVTAPELAPAQRRAGPGDAWRVADSPGLRLRAQTDSELLVWAFAFDVDTAS